ADQTLAALGSRPPAWLVVDHYAIDARWHRHLRPACIHLLAIDDLADRNHDSDLLLDQNLGRGPVDYQGLVPSRCTLLTGPKYALLRPQFRARRSFSLQRRKP